MPIVWSFFIVGIAGLLASALRWGRKGALLGWLLGGLAAVMGPWAVTVANGEDALWSLVLLVLIQGSLWALVGGMVAIVGLVIHDVLLAKDDPRTLD